MKLKKHFAALLSTCVVATVLGYFALENPKDYSRQNIDEETTHDSKELAAPAIIEIESNYAVEQESDFASSNNLEELELAENDESNEIPEADMLSSYAQEYGVSEEEAMRRLRREDGLARSLNQIVAIQADRVAGWGINHKGEYSAWIQITGEEKIDKTTESILKQNPDIEIRYGATYSFAQLRGAQEHVEQIQRNELPEDLQKAFAFSDVNMENNSLTVAFDLDSLALETQQDRDVLLASAEAHLSSRLDTAVTVISEIKATPDATYSGGQAISGCTSAFPVQQDGTRGITTAGHCGNNVASGLRFRGEVFRDATDAQWHSPRSGNNIATHFRTRSNEIRYATGTRSRSTMIGRYVCHWGKNSGYSCGTVESITHRPSYVESANDFVRVKANALRSCGGDSGGPWFNGRVAYGIHSGSSNPSERCDRAINYALFGSIRTAQSSLGVSIIRHR